MSLDELANQEAKHFCVMNTKELPHYSTERFYMLSELEVHAHSVQFVCDTPQEKSSHVILYILWRPEENPCTPSAFCDELLQPCILHFFDDLLKKSVEESTAHSKRAAHSIGLSLSHSSDHDCDDVQAAPGLEACHEAVPMQRDGGENGLGNNVRLHLKRRIGKESMILSGVW